MIPKRICYETRGQSKYPFLFQIPPKKGRYLLVDTETTGILKGNYLTEIGGLELIDGILFKNIFKVRFAPKIIKEKILKKTLFETEKKFEETKKKLNRFRTWVGNSIIFAHNATFDMRVLNDTLSSFELAEIPEVNFRCSMRIFLEVVGVKDPLLNKNNMPLKECCRYFGLKTFGKKYHTAETDVEMLGHLLLKIYKELETNPKVSNIFDYNDPDDLESHYKIYMSLKKRNNRVNSYNDEFFQPLNNYEIPPFLKGNSELTRNDLMDDKEAKIKKMVKDDLQNEKIEEKNDINLFERKIKIEKKEEKISSDIANKIINEYEQLKK